MNMRLLVCDDDEAVGKLLHAIYTREGWVVDVVTTGRDCIASVATAPPDVIVLDHMMPGLTGLETAQVLRNDGFTNPIVLFSAYLGPDLDANARELDLIPISKIDTRAVVRVVDVLGRRIRIR